MDMLLVHAEGGDVLINKEWIISVRDEPAGLFIYTGHTLGNSIKIPKENADEIASLWAYFSSGKV